MRAPGQPERPGPGLTVRELEAILHAHGCSRREVKRLAGAVPRECAAREDFGAAAQRLIESLKAS